MIEASDPNSAEFRVYRSQQLVILMQILTNFVYAGYDRWFFDEGNRFEDCLLKLELQIARAAVEELLSTGNGLNVARHCW